MSIYNKYVNRKNENINYVITDIKDIIGIRFITLYGNDLLIAFNSALEYLSLCNTDYVRLLDVDHVVRNLESIKVYHRKRNDKDPYVRAFQYIYENYRDFARVTLHHKDDGYSSIHVNFRVAHLVAGVARSFPVEIQIRTALEDVWAEISHELKYKSTYIIGERETHLNRILSTANDAIVFLKENIDNASTRVDELKDNYSYIDAHVGTTRNIECRFDDKRSILYYYFLSIDRGLFDKLAIYLSIIDNCYFNIWERMNRRSVISVNTDLNRISEACVAIEGIVSDNTSLERCRNALKVFSLHFQVLELVHGSLKKRGASQQTKLRNIYENLRTYDQHDIRCYRLWVQYLIERQIGTTPTQLETLEGAYNALTPAFRDSELGCILPRLLSYKLFETRILPKIMSQRQMNNSAMKKIASNTRRCLILAIEARAAVLAFSIEDNKKKGEISVLDNNIVSYYDILTKHDGRIDPKFMVIIKESARSVAHNYWQQQDVPTSDRFRIQKLHTAFLAARLTNMDTSLIRTQIKEAAQTCSDAGLLRYILSDVQPPSGNKTLEPEEFR